MEETVRLRLVLDRSLRKSQKTEGLKRCWILLKPQHQTISDLSSYILHIFHLYDACPHGLLLSMEGFVLPPFESTCILKDKDTIRVKKRGRGGDSLSELITVGDGLNSLDVVEIVENQPVATGMNLLANEEFEKESGGYESEPEEDAAEQENGESLHVEKTRELENISKKRKASKDLHNSKKKKNKSVRAENYVAVLENFGNNDQAEQKVTLSTAKIGKRSDKSSKAMHSAKRLCHLEREWECGAPYVPDHRTMGVGLFTAYKDCLNRSSNAIRSCQPQENGDGIANASLTPCGVEKLPSRSARRKKAKRQWLREQRKTEKKEQNQVKLVENINQQASQEYNHNVSEESPEKRNLIIPEEIPETDGNKLKDDQQQDQGSDVEDDVVPVVIRPGHIRFEPLNKVGAVQTVLQNQIPVEIVRWNGITSKKKGQKWGKEKAASRKGNGYNNFNQECPEMLNIEKETPVYDHIDFDSLPFYTSLPKEGDVIAYRLIELSSSWTPELSSYRVGKISWYDLESHRIILLPVPEYPVIPEKIDDRASAALSETSPYGEDGSLQISFSSLIEVRIVNLCNPTSKKSVAGGVNEDRVRDQDAGTSFRPNNNNEAHASAQANGEVNPWKELNQALKEKKAQLSQEDNWGETKRSGRSQWSYKALRGSALGPTMALLRAQNEL